MLGCLDIYLYISMLIGVALRAFQYKGYYNIRHFKLASKRFLLRVWPIQAYLILQIMQKVLDLYAYYVVYYSIENE